MGVKGGGERRAGLGLCTRLCLCVRDRLIGRGACGTCLPAWRAPPPKKKQTNTHTRLPHRLGPGPAPGRWLRTYQRTWCGTTRISGGTRPARCVSVGGGTSAGGEEGARGGGGEGTPEARGRGVGWQLGASGRLCACTRMYRYSVGGGCRGGPALGQGSPVAKLNGMNEWVRGGGCVCTTQMSRTVQHAQGGSRQVGDGLTGRQACMRVRGSARWAVLCGGSGTLGGVRHWPRRDVAGGGHAWRSMQPEAGAALWA